VKEVGKGKGPWPRSSLAKGKGARWQEGKGREGSDNTSESPAAVRARAITRKKGEYDRYLKGLLAARKCAPGIPKKKKGERESL